MYLNNSFEIKKTKPFHSRVVTEAFLTEAEADAKAMSLTSADAEVNGGGGEGESGCK